MTSKPPLPEHLFAPWERIPVDTESGPFREIRSLAVHAADSWLLGEDGPYKDAGMTMAQITRRVVEEGLLHLLELGLIDVDADRINNAKGWPLSRSAFLPTTTEEQR